MGKRLVGNIQVLNNDAYISTETTDSEIILSLHIPYKMHSEFIDSRS